MREATLRRGEPLIGPLLAGCSLLIWVAFSILPALNPPAGVPSRFREAWDTEAYWSIGLPLLLVAQAAAGGLSRGPLWPQPLWSLVGHVAGLLLVPGTGASFGLLPLTVLVIGLPGYVALMAAAATGRLLRRWL